MYYEITGTKEKKAFVFLHGWGGSTVSFLPVINRLPFDEYCFVNFDFWGFGKSGQPQKALSIKDYADEVYEILKKENLKDVVLVGHSFGGRVAIKLAANYDDIIEKIVLVDSAGIKPRRGIVFKFKIFKYKLYKKLAQKKLIKNFDLKKYGSDDYRGLSDLMKQTFIKVVNEDLSKDAKLIKKPTLIVWGKNDKDTKLYMAKKLKKFIKDSEMIVFKNAGHYSYLDKLDDFVYILYAYSK